MKRLPSIARRLSWTVLASALIWSLAVSVAVWLTVRAEVSELLDDTLRSTAYAMQPSLAALNLPAPPPADAPPEDAYAWQIVRYGVGPAEVLAASALAPKSPFVARSTTGFVSTAEWRVYGSALDVDNRVLYVAQTLHEVNEATLETALNAALATLAVALLAHLWLRGRIARELEPVQRLSERLQAHDLLAPSATLGPAERAELAPVHVAIDALAAQLARRLANERAFSAHAAHSLRTPLAGIDAQLAAALREAPATLQPRLQRVRAAAGRLQRVVAALLALFRSGVELRRETLDLAGLLARLPVEGLDVDVRAGTALHADADLLSAALLNLMDNALRHGARTLHITQPAANTLRFDDDGPGVDAERRRALQAMIDQGGHEDAGGGLGLMLADLVARAHGGRLSLPEAARGFAVELQLGANATPDDATLQ